MSLVWTDSYEQTNRNVISETLANVDTSDLWAVLELTGT